MKANYFYNSIVGLEFIGTCVDHNIEQIEEHEKGCVKADYKKVERLIKKHIPELVPELTLDIPNCYNPYRHLTERKKDLIIYYHSGIHYFFKPILK